MSKNHLHDLFLGNIASEKQSDGFGNGPAVFTQQPLPEQAQMFVAAFVLEITDIDPDITIAYINRKNLKVVTFFIEASTAFQIETPSVPVAGENAMTNGTSGQR